MTNVCYQKPQKVIDERASVVYVAHTVHVRGKRIVKILEPVLGTCATVHLLLGNEFRSTIVSEGKFD
jgi:hypothetical protein